VKPIQGIRRIDLSDTLPDTSDFQRRRGPLQCLQSAPIMVGSSRRRAATRTTELLPIKLALNAAGGLHPFLHKRDR